MKKIKMAGIDHKRAILDERELFSFTKTAAAIAIKQWRCQYPEAGFVLISTCNRTELWIHDQTQLDISPFHLLCSYLGADEENLNRLCIKREGREAVEHLFRLACGMESQIFGEDQIISQVKDALSLARSVHAPDCTLEKLFQMAVTGAKKVKSTARLTLKDTSVVEKAIETLKLEGDLSNKVCFVIGNGEIGRLAAQRLLEEKANVTMTVRQYKTGEIIIPFGCQVIPYEERYPMVAKADIIISATASPHHTLHYEQAVVFLSDNKRRLLMDLAVPRDISVRLDELPNIRRCDIDTLGAAGPDSKELEQIQYAESILNKYIDEFEIGYYFKDWLPVIEHIGREVSGDILNRLDKLIDSLSESLYEQKKIEAQIELSARKSVTKLLYGLKDTMEKEQWGVCLKALELSMEKEP